MHDSMLARTLHYKIQGLSCGMLCWHVVLYVVHGVLCCFYIHLRANTLIETKVSQQTPEQSVDGRDQAVVLGAVFTIAVVFSVQDMFCIDSHRQIGHIELKQRWLVDKG